MGLHVHSTDAALSSLAFFNDSRCTNSCVKSTDPLFLTCKLNNIAGLRVIFPNGVQEIISIGDNVSNPESVVLPDGFIAVSLNIMSVKDVIKRNVSLTLSIANASRLNGQEIICDDTTPRNEVMAGCPVCGKF